MRAAMTMFSLLCSLGLLLGIHDPASAKAKAKAAGRGSVVTIDLDRILAEHPDAIRNREDMQKEKEELRKKLDQEQAAVQELKAKGDPQANKASQVLFLKRTKETVMLGQRQARRGQAFVTDLKQKIRKKLTRVLAPAGVQLVLMERLLAQADSGMDCTARALGKRPGAGKCRGAPALKIGFIDEDRLWRETETGKQAQRSLEELKKNMPPTMAEVMAEIKATREGGDRSELASKQEEFDKKLKAARNRPAAMRKLRQSEEKILADAKAKIAEDVSAFSKTCGLRAMVWTKDVLLADPAIACTDAFLNRKPRCAGFSVRRLGLLDLDKAIAESRIGKRTTQEIAKKSAQLKAEIKGQSGPGKLRQRMAQRKKITEEINSLRDSMTDELKAKIRAAAIVIAKKHKTLVLLPARSAFGLRPGMDITAEVIRLLDKKYK